MTSSFKKVSSHISTPGVEFFLRSKFKTSIPLFVFLLLSFAAFTLPLAAQVNVTTADDLNLAIGTINTSAAAGTVHFLVNSLDLAALTSPLGTFQFEMLIQTVPVQ
jgi:hypothetical protein